MNILKFKFRTLLTFLFVSVSMLMPTAAWADFDANGFGTGNDAGKYQEPPFNNGFYQIGNAGQLYWFAQTVNSGAYNVNAKLIKDIVVNEGVLEKVEAGNVSDLRSWSPIGDSYDQCYSGLFDGQGFSISGLYYHTDYYKEYVGLFGYVRNKNNYVSTISNIIINDSYFKGYQNVGGIVGYMSGDKGTIKNCITTVKVSSIYGSGGICGYLSTNYGGIEKCFSKGSIAAGEYNAGGICGYLSHGTINNCGFVGTVNNGLNGGGICGTVSNSTYLNNSFCYISNSNIKTVAQNYGNINNCYYLANAEVDDGGKTAVQFANGEVCASLNSENENPVWRQLLGTDDYPSYEGNEVAGSTCDHNYVDGVCSICGSVKQLDMDAEGYYLISSVADLTWFANQVNGGNNSINGRLTADITFDGETLWQPMGASSNSFKGKFDGNYYFIRGLYIKSDSKYDGVGFFGAIENATVKNLKIEKARIEAKGYVGGFCGYANSSAISQCFFDGEIITNNNYVGGICGYAYNGTTITQCGNKAHIIAGGYVAGIAYGYSYDVEVSYCFNWGTIEGQNSCGILCNSGSVTNSYNTGTATYEIFNGQTNNVISCYGLGKCKNANGATIKSVADFESGSVCKLLNSYSSVWSQKIGSDLYPTFDVKNILSQESFKCKHDYKNGFCSKCAGYEPAVLNEDYYEISNAGQLYWFVSNQNKETNNGRLMNDIVVNEDFDATNITDASNLRVWTPYSYGGKFDGQNFTISGLYNGTDSRVGLFSDLYNAQKGTEILNLKVRNTYFYGTWETGGISAYSDGVTITNCSVGGIIKGEGYTGGICGNARNTTISKCYVLANVYDVAPAGSTIYIGGICGLSESYCTIENCYVAGKVVSGNEHKGAISGYGDSYKTTNINNSIYVGETTGINLFLNVKSSNCYNINDDEDRFKEGEICWLLNGYKADGIWRQTLGTDKYPTFEGLKVSQTADYTYVNKKEPIIVDGYYELADADDLYWFAAKVNAGETTINARVVADIVVNENVIEKVEAGETDGLRMWIPIGNGQFQYMGTFDGGGYVISGLYYDGSNIFAGLFGFCNDAKIITNVHIRDSYINGNNNPAAGICGYINSNGKQGYISKCSFDGIVIGSLTAGICNSTSSPIEDCYNLGTIVNGFGIGNAMNPSLISNSYSIGSRIVGGHANNCFYLSDEETADGGRTAEQFANGRVCWELNNGSTEGVWRQTNGDNYPSFVGERIDFTSCNHDYSRGNGICNKCGTKCKHEEHSITGICTICGLACEHHYIDSKCVCGAVCEHPEFKNEACAICGKICSHDHYENGACNVCGIYQTPEQDVEGYYLLANANNLYWFAHYVNNTDANINVRVVNDITVNENLIKKINNSEFDGLKFWNSIIEFKGKFDGAGHTISGLVCSESTSGFFKSAFYAEIHGINIRDSYFAGLYYAAGICAEARGNTKISNCSFDGMLIEAEFKAGICSENSGSIENCYNLASIEKGMGICAINSGTISNCYNYNVNALSPIYYAPLNEGTVENCYYLSDEETADGGRTKEQFQYGKVCWELNGESTDEDVVWRQNVGTDPYPTFVGNVVDYKPCTEHHYVDGMCDVCGVVKLPDCNDGYYLLSNANDLYWFAKKVNAGNFEINARLVNDIVVNEKIESNIVDTIKDNGEDIIDYILKDYRTWVPIAKNEENPYKGHFDGNGHSISGLVGYSNISGFIAWASDATITKLSIKNSLFLGEAAAGICVAGQGPKFNISQCSFDGIIYGVVPSGICVLSEGEIADCYNLGSVENGAGICAMNYGTVSNCYNYNNDVNSPISFPGESMGVSNNCYYLSDEETEDGGRTAAQFADGTVTALLNAGRTGNELVWFQNGDKPGFEQAEAPAKKLLLNDNSFAFVEGMEYDTVTYTRTGIESNWASLCLPFAFTTDDCKEGGITLFAVNGIKDGAIILEQVTSVSAGEPVLFYSSTKADLKIVVTGNIQLTNSPNEELDLKGSFVEQTIYTTDFPDREIYYLKNNQYLKGNGNFKLKPFHAFLAGEADVNVKSLRIAMPNEVVDESVVEDETFNMVNPSIFNVSGQRVSNMRNGGVYIIKKMDGTVQKVHIVE